MSISRIIVIHCAHDDALCHTLVHYLRGVKYHVWYDKWTWLREHTPTGISVPYVLPEGDIYLLLISEAAQVSELWQHRRQQALASDGVVLPLLCEPTNVEGFLQLSHFLSIVGLDESQAARSVITELELIATNKIVQKQIEQDQPTSTPNPGRARCFSPLFIGIVFLLVLTTIQADAVTQPAQSRRGPPNAITSSVVYFGSVDRNVYAVNKHDGILLWKHWLGGPTGNLDVVLAKEVVYVSSGDDGLIYALRARDGTELWRYHFSDKIYHVTVSDDIVYAASNDIYKMVSDGPASVCALRANTGALLWCHNVVDTIFVSSLIVKHGVVYTVTFLGYLYALRSSDGYLLWSHKLKASSQGISVAADSVYTTAGNELCAWRASDGGKLWCYGASMDAVSSPFVFQSTVYFGSDDGYVHVFTPTGKPLWQYLVPGGNTPTDFALADGIVCVFVVDKNKNDIGYVYGLTTNGGTLIWSYQVNGGVNAFAIFKHVLYIGASDGIYAVTLQTGALVWFYSNSASPPSPRLLVNNSGVYFGSFGKKLYALSMNGQLLWRYMTGGTVGSPVTGLDL